MHKFTEVKLEEDIKEEKIACQHCQIMWKLGGVSKAGNLCAIFAKKPDAPVIQIQSKLGMQTFQLLFTTEN